MLEFARFCKKEIPQCLLLLLFFLTSTSCVEMSENSELTGTGKPQVALLICMTEETPFFMSLVKGAQKASDELNAELIVYYAHDDPEIQIEQLKTVVDDGVEAIILNPVSDDVCPVIKEISFTGIPVFTIDRSSNCENIVSHIASNNLEGGAMAGVYLSEMLNRKGIVVELSGTEGSSAATERGRGFHEAIENYPEIEIVYSASASFNRSEGRKIFEDILSKFPVIDGVFAHNDDMILGAIEASKEAQRLDEIVFIGFDGTEEAISSLEKNELTATVAQRPEEMGRIGIETVMKYLSGEDVPDTIFIELALITK
ncbi:substrate-binding domain-containing protein [candidate division WOR-3 bacterium]|nr:substrate-binding domain-containing protein [candidate division WOR-3 bacterium]